MAVRDVLIAFMGTTAQAQAEATKEAHRAGIANAKVKVDATDYKGRKPSCSRDKYDQVIDLLGKSASVTQVATEIGLTRQTIYRIKDEPAAAEKALAMWCL